MQLTGREVFSGQQALVTYRFPLTSDMFAFQSAIRGRLIRHVFDVEFIKSNRGTETTHQHVKIWSDSNNDNFTLSFYVKEERSQGAHLEFPIACFLQTPATHKTDPHFVRIYFRLRTQPPMLKTSSGYPTSEASSPLGTRARQERRSFSSSTSPTLSMFKIFTKSPQPKNTTPPLSPPTERIQQRGRIYFSSTTLGDIDSCVQENSTSGSAESQSTNDTTIGSMASIFPAQDLKVDPHSEAMQHLDFRFNFASGTWYPFYRPSNLVLGLRNSAHVKINPQMRGCLPQNFGKSLPDPNPLTLGAIQYTTNQATKVTHLRPLLPAILLRHQKSTPTRRTK